MSAALPIFPTPRSQAEPRLVGIAKLAAQGEALDEGHNVEYITLEAKSVLNRCTAKHMPFTWTINPYRGCEFACKYCYARYTHEFMEMRDGLEFERKIFVKQHTAWLLRRDLKRVKVGEDIAMGTATDPYQPAERRFGMTRSILEELALHSGLSIGMVTKSNLVLRDIDVLKKISASNSLVVNVTVTTIDADLARLLEPRAPRPDLRLEAVRKLNDAGVNAAVICAPVLPQITDSSANLDSVVRAAMKAGAQYVYCNPLFLKPCSEKVFMPFLEQHFPHLVESYRKRYGANAYVSPAYRKRIYQLMETLCKKHGMPDRERRREMRESNGAQQETNAEQLSLF
jgi:DNA repair photolyase